MPILLPDTPGELIWELNKPIFVGEAVRLTDLPAGSWSGSGHLNRCHEAVDASPHPNGSSPLGPLGLPTKWDGLGGAGIGIYGLSRHPAGRGSGRGGIRGWDRAGGGAAGERPWAPKALKNLTGWS